MKIVYKVNYDMINELWVKLHQNSFINLERSNVLNKHTNNSGYLGNLSQNQLKQLYIELLELKSKLC